MSFRDWVDATLTNFILWVAGIADGGFTTIWVQAYYRVIDLERDRENVKNGVRWFFSWIPDVLGFARDFFTSLIIGYVVDPVYNVLTWPFNFLTERLDNLWVGSWGHYKPVKYGMDALYHVKDRLLDLIDFTTSLVEGVRSFLTGLLSEAYNTLMGFINEAVGALNAWAAWVRDTVWANVQELASSLADTNRMLTQVYYDLDAIRRDPASWVWTHVEPRLQSLVSAWLDRIWYSRG